MKEIGGYLDLELNNYNSLYHDNCIAVNSGRNALEYIIKQNKIKKLLIPIHICPVIIEKLEKLNMDYSFYNISKSFFPILDFPQYHILYINYYGIMDRQASLLKKKYSNKLIIDNSQSFFSKPLSEVFTFYSSRKFFGVPDGGFVYSPSKKKQLSLETDNSESRISHLVKRIEKGAEYGYNKYQLNEKYIGELPLKEMSNFTKKLHKNINFKQIKEKRILNFQLLHEKLKQYNELTKNIEENKNEIESPLIYPLIIENAQEVRKRLKKNKIYTPIYWETDNYIEKKKSVFEKKLSSSLIALPIDQRYCQKDLNKILEVINKELK